MTSDQWGGRTGIKRSPPASTSQGGMEEGGGMKKREGEDGQDHPPGLGKLSLDLTRPLKREVKKHKRQKESGRWVQALL